MMHVKSASIPDIRSVHSHGGSLHRPRANVHHCQRRHACFSQIGTLSRALRRLLSVLQYYRLMDSTVMPERNERSSHERPESVRERSL